MEKQILDDQRNIRKEVMMRHVLHLLQSTVQLQGVSIDTPIDGVMAVMTDDSAKVIAPLVEAVTILEEIIFASDGCQGHRECVHSMEPWQRARTLLQGKWESEDRVGARWPSL